MKVLVIGGSRFVGPLLIEKLLANDHKVTVFNRGQISTKYPDDVDFIKGDRNQGFDAIKEHFDIVIDMCAYTGAQTKAVLEELNYDFFLHFGTVASYKQPSLFPLSEEAPSGIWPFMGDYNKGKAECEHVLEASKKPYASIRPTYILGPDNYIDRENFIYSRIDSGEKIVIPGNGQALIQFVFAKDVVDIILMLIEKRLEGAFNCVGDEMITGVSLTEYMATLVGKKPDISFNPQADGENHIEDEFPFANENLICTNQKLKDLGFTFTPLLEGIKNDYESYYKALL